MVFPLFNSYSYAPPPETWGSAQGGLFLTFSAVMAYGALKFPPPTALVCWVLAVRVGLALHCETALATLLLRQNPLPAWRLQCCVPVQGLAPWEHDRAQDWEVVIFPCTQEGMEAQMKPLRVSQVAQPAVARRPSVMWVESLGRWVGRLRLMGLAGLRRSVEVWVGSRRLARDASERFCGGLSSPVRIKVPMLWSLRAVMSLLFVGGPLLSLPSDEVPFADPEMQREGFRQTASTT